MSIRLLERNPGEIELPLPYAVHTVMLHLANSSSLPGSASDEAQSHVNKNIVELYHRFQ
jgi:hypothetical protein